MSDILDCYKRKERQITAADILSEIKEVMEDKECTDGLNYNPGSLVEAFKEIDAKKKYTIETRKNIYRGFAKRCKKDIKKRMKKSHYGAYLLDIASLYPVPLTKAVIALGEFEK